jgi:hypothetical protein
MGDAIHLSDLPTGLDLYAGYDDGQWPDAAAIAAAFAGKPVIRITVFASDNEGDCLDVETGDATPVQAPGWVTKRRAAGHGGPLVYCSWSAFPSVQTAFANAGVHAPGYWVAGYPAPDGDAIPAGTVGHQWIDHGAWDESIMVDYLPGIDPPPVPPPLPPHPPTPQENDTVTSLLEGTQKHVWALVNNVAIHWWQDTAAANTGWQVEKLPAVPA